MIFMMYIRHTNDFTHSINSWELLDSPIKEDVVKDHSDVNAKD
jgi:hypothetical protein